MTDEQLLAFMTGQGDMSVAEKKLANQQALSGALRQQALSPSAGKDYGSQIARGISGLGAGYMGSRGDQTAFDAFTGSKNKMLGGMRDLLLKKPPAPPAAPMPNVQTPPMSNADMTGLDY